MNRTSLNLYLLVALVSSWVFAVADTRSAARSDRVTATRQSGAYRLRICKESEESRCRLDIRRDGKLVWLGRGYRYFLDGRTYEDLAPGQPPPVPAGSDLNKDGLPEAVVCAWTGGNPGYWTILVFQFGPRLKVLQIIDAGGLAPEFRDLDQDGMPEMIVEDSTFRYWPNCRIPDQPRVVLKGTGRRYAIAPALMGKSAPTEAELRRKAGVVRSSPAWSTTSDALVYVLGLIYSGHEALAREFLHMVWPRPSRQEAALLKAFAAELATSPYYPMIREAQRSANTSSP